MNALDPVPATTNPVASAPKPARRPRISRSIRNALELWASGQARSMQAAAEQAGIARQTLWKALKRADVQEDLERRRKRAMERAKVNAWGTINRLMEGAASEHVQAQVALKVAARELEPEAASINVGLSVGYVINLSDAPLNGPVIEHQRQDEANPLIPQADGEA